MNEYSLAKVQYLFITLKTSILAGIIDGFSRGRTLKLESEDNFFEIVAHKGGD